MSFSFKNIGHWFAVVAHIFVVAASEVANIAPLVGQVEKAAEPAVGLFAPGVIPLMQAAQGAYGHVAEALTALKTPLNADGSLNVTISPTVVAAVQATMGAVDAFGQAAGITKPVVP